MKLLYPWLAFMLSLMLASNAFAWNQRIQSSEEIREVLNSGIYGELTLSVNMYQYGLVDIAVNTARGGTIPFPSEWTEYSCSVSYELFVVGEN